MDFYQFLVYNLLSFINVNLNMSKDTYDLIVEELQSIVNRIQMLGDKTLDVKKKAYIHREEVQTAAAVKKVREM